MHALEQNLRVHPTGSTLQLRREFGFITFERVRAVPGRFAATFGQYAIIMSPGSVHGWVQLNGSRVFPGPTSPNVYSVLRPNDHVSGLLEREIVYDILLIAPDFVEQLIRNEANDGRATLPLTIRVEAPPLVRSLWRRLSACVESSDADTEYRARTLVELLIVKLIEVQIGTPNPADVARNLEAVRRAVTFIDGHLSEKLDVEAIARAADLSPFHFSRVFKTAYQMSLHKFVLERRLERARQLLLESDLPISSVALETGFSSQSHLTTAFGQRFGVPPAQFRAGQGWGASPAGAEDKTDRT